MEKTISEYKNKIEEFANKIEEFATKPAFVFIVCAAAFFFHAFALDLVGLILFALTGGAFLIAFKDVRPSLTVIFFAIFVVSTQNSTWPKGVSDFYFRTSTIITLVICGAILIACMVFRCVKHKENYRGAKSILPLAALSLSMILSGAIPAGSNRYGESLLFGLIGVASYLGLYLLLTGIVDGFDGLFDYAMTLFSGVALIISLEVVYVYVLNLLPPFEFLPENWRRCMRSGDFFDSIGRWKTYIVTGCGMSNQSGAMIAFLLPAVFYKISNTKNYFGYELLALFAAVSIMLTLSRTAIVVGGTLFIVLSIVTAIKLQKKTLFLSVLGAFVGAGAILFVILLLNGKSALLDYLLPSKGPGLNGRWTIWKDAVNYFTERPIFGVGFAYPYHNDSTASNIFGALFHNFIFQALGSGGIFGIAATLYAVVDVCRRTIKEKYDGKFYILCFIGAFATICMFDILYFVPYYISFLMFVIVMAEKGINQAKKTSGQEDAKK